MERRSVTSAHPLEPFGNLFNLRNLRTIPKWGLIAMQLLDVKQRDPNTGTSVQAVDVYKGWTEIDTFEDYQRAWADLR